MNNDEILVEFVLDIVPEEVKRSGKAREYFEHLVFSRWWPDLSEDEKRLMTALTKATLDKAFPA